MNDEDQTDKKSDDPKKTDRNPLAPAHTALKVVPITWRVVGGALLGVLVLALVAFLLPNMKERMKFFVDTSLGWLVLVVVALQAYIYNRQARIMQDGLKQNRKALQISERAYVGISSIEMAPAPSRRKVILKIENIGRLPGRGIRINVDMILLAHGQTPATANWWNDFGRTNLFKGNLIEIQIPLEAAFNGDLLTVVFAGHARLIAQIRINYRDGFRDTQRRVSDYAFRFDSGKWLAWPVWTIEDIEGRCRQEQERYPKPASPAPESRV